MKGPYAKSCYFPSAIAKSAHIRGDSCAERNAIFKKEDKNENEITHAGSG